MATIAHLDGIIIIDDNKNELFGITYRNSGQVVLRINTLEAEKIKSLNVHKHFDAFNQKYKDQPVKLMTYEQIKVLLDELLNLTEEELEKQAITIDYIGVGNIEVAHNSRNMFILIFVLWSLIFIRWLIHNRTFFFGNYEFYAFRVCVFYSLKILHCLIFLTLLHFNFYLSERVMYTNYRFISELLLWLSFCIRVFSIGMMVSLIYSFSKDTAFSLIDKWDDVYVLSILCMPFFYILSTILSLMLVTQIYFLYFLIVFYIGCTTAARCCKYFLLSWNRAIELPENLILYKRSIFATCFG
jgi:hypothetical protein